MPDKSLILNSEALTKGQMMIWMGQQLMPEEPLYNVVFTFDLYGEVNGDVFQEAFAELVRQSDAMRTVFLVEKGEVRQRIQDDIFYEFPLLDWSGKTTTTKELEAWVAERGNHIFDLEKLAFDTALIKIADGHYVWFLNQHHIITDASGQAVQFKAFLKIYRALQKDALAELPPLPLYQEYRAFEAEQQQLPVPAYWQSKQLPKRLPFYGKDVENAGTGSRRVKVALGAQRYRRLEELAQDPKLRHWTKDLTFFNLLSTILFAYLHRISGRTTIAIGTPAHNRSKAKFQHTPGIFIEVLPLATSVEEGDTFLDLFLRVRNETNEFLRASRPALSAPELARSFNVVLNYIHASFRDQDSEFPVRATWHHNDHADPNHQLRLQVYNFGEAEEIQIDFDLNTSVFRPQLCEEVPRHFLAILDAFLADYNQPVQQVPLLDEAMKESLLAQCKGPQRAVPQKSVISQFEEQTSSSPQAVAAQFGDRKISYDDLNRKANQLAHLLRKHLDKPQAIVAIHLSRSFELLEGILGVGKAGYTYLPIPAHTPPKRLRLLLEKSGAAMLLTTTDLFDAEMETGLPVILLDQDAALLTRHPATRPDITRDLDTAAYLMYTSGSTGEPKGVVISQRALANYIQYAEQQYVQVPAPVFPLFTSIGFDLTVTSLFTPLVCGGKIIIYPEAAPDMPDLAVFQVLQDNLADVLKLTPSHLSLLPDESLKNARLRTMIIGGEQLTTELALRIKSALPEGVNMYNEYGPTEVTVGAVVHEFSAEDTCQEAVSIGKPIANLSAYVLDQYNHLQPSGVIGELFLAGPSLANGYWNNEEATTDKFLPNPFESGSKMYRTGDLAYHNADGDLVFCGRRDRQVKHRGFRLELNEIELALSTFPGIGQVAVELVSAKETDFHQELHYCTNCGLPSNYPNAEYDEEGVCQLCLNFETYQEKARAYFKTPDDLRALFAQRPTENGSEYDCIMLLSGGKDSTYALGQLVEMGLKVLAFTLDNGYISQQALDNVQRVAKELGVDCIVGSTPAMNAIFVDSLHRHCNVCNGCFKTIYTLSTKIALEKNIPFIVTGLSRGQFFETRLTEELFWQGKATGKNIDDTILEARKIYHQADDAVKELLDVSMFEDDTVFEKVQFVDFYRYTDATLDEMLEYLDNRLPWVRPTDTGRSTNCLINQLGIHVHKKEKGYNNYAFPYSWDVRIGHKERDAALEEINEEVDQVAVEAMMDEIGYRRKETTESTQYLTAYFSAETNIAVQRIKDYLAARLPNYMIPGLFIQQAALPLTSNGKIDRKALVRYTKANQIEATAYEAPTSDMEQFLAEIWSTVLGLEKIGVNEKFLDLGGHSLLAIRLSTRINEALDLQIPLKTIFEQPTIAQQAAFIESLLQELMAE